VPETGPRLSQVVKAEQLSEVQQVDETEVAHAVCERRDGGIRSRIERQVEQLCGREIRLVDADERESQLLLADEPRQASRDLLDSPEPESVAVQLRFAHESEQFVMHSGVLAVHIRE